MATIKVWEEKGLIFIEMQGEVVLNDVKKFKEKVKDQIAEKTHLKILVDMTKVEFVDSSGLGLLISWYKMVNEKAGQIVYFGLGSYVKKIMNIAKLDKIFPIAQNKEEALTQIEQMQ